MILLFVETNRSPYLSTVQFSRNQPPPYPPPYTFPCNPYQMLSITTYTVSPSTSAATTTSASSSCRSKHTSSLNDKTTFPRVPCYATRCAVPKSLSPYPGPFPGKKYEYILHHPWRFCRNALFIYLPARLLMLRFHNVFSYSFISTIIISSVHPLFECGRVQRILLFSQASAFFWSIHQD